MAAVEWSALTGLPAERRARTTTRLGGFKTDPSAPILREASPPLAIKLLLDVTDDAFALEFSGCLADKDDGRLAHKLLNVCRGVLCIGPAQKQSLRITRAEVDAAQAYTETESSDRTSSSRTEAMSRGRVRKAAARCRQMEALR